MHCTKVHTAVSETTLRSIKELETQLENVNKKIEQRKAKSLDFDAYKRIAAAKRDVDEIETAKVKVLRAQAALETHTAEIQQSLNKLEQLRPNLILKEYSMAVAAHKYWFERMDLVLRQHHPDFILPAVVQLACTPTPLIRDPVEIQRHLENFNLL